MVPCSSKLMYDHVKLRSGYFEVGEYESGVKKLVSYLHPEMQVCVDPREDTSLFSGRAERRKET